MRLSRLRYSRCPLEKRGRTGASRVDKAFAEATPKGGAGGSDFSDATADQS